MNTREREVMDALATALRDARDSVASELGIERAAFKGYEGSSNIAQLEAEMVAIDSALSASDALLAEGSAEKCFCDEKYPDSNRAATCGDCPRDYKGSASSEGEQRITVADVARLIECKVADVLHAGRDKCSLMLTANQMVSVEDAVLLARWTLHEQRGMRAAIESAHPHGLPAGSDAQLKVIDEVIRLLESPAVMPTPTGGINYTPEHYFSLLHDFKRVRSELATAEQPSCGQVVRDAAWILVPKEPTSEMVCAGFESDEWDALSDAVLSQGKWPYSCKESAQCVAGIFLAMCAAAPTKDAAEDRK